MEEKKVGVVCTIGPSSIERTKELENHGMSIARFNGSFGFPSQELINRLNVPVLLDLPGERKKKRYIPYLSDEELIKLAIDLKLDYIGISYIKSPQDILNILPLIRDSDVKIVAKIETKEAYERMEEIISIPEVSLVLVDRGDLGSAIGYEKVPLAQKKIIEKCKQLNKKVIVATEMMMSTIKNEKPSIADINDVYHTVSQGADYLMLSEETAIGEDALRPLKIMKEVINYANSNK